MACSCNGSKQRAGATTSAGLTVQGYQVTYPDGSVAPNLFLTPIEAKKEVRRHGGGTVREITS